MDKNGDTLANYVAEERRELANLVVKAKAPKLVDVFSSPQKDSSLKRVTSFIRKLKSISPESSVQIIQDIADISLTMHYSEVCSAILENRPKNSHEYFCISKVIICIISETSEEFVQIFCRELLRSIESLTQFGLSVSDKANFLAFRCYFRLAVELHVVKASGNRFLSLNTHLQKLLSQNEDKSAEFIPFVTAFLKNFRELTVSGFSDDRLMNDVYETTKSFFKTMCRYSLRIFQNFKNLEAKAQKIYEQKSDVFKELKVSLLSALEDFKSLRQNMIAFADVLNLQLPVFEDSDPKFLVEDDNIVFKAEIEFETDIYQDETEREFYEKLPANTADEALNDEPSFLDEWNVSTETDKLLENVGIDPEQLEKSVNTTKLPKGMDQFFHHIESILTFEDADKISGKILSAGKTPKISQYYENFFGIVRKKIELIKFIARIIATVKRSQPVLVENLTRSIIGQFFFLTNKNYPAHRTRRIICTYLSEFTKFRIFSQSAAFLCLKQCLKDFSGANIDMMTMILESCGRFLYLQPESHARMKHLIAKVSNFRKNSLLIPNDKNIQLGHAIFCVTKVKNIDFNIEPDFMLTFFSFSINRSSSPESCSELIGSIIFGSTSEDVEKLILFLSQAHGFELSKFDHLVGALAILKTTHEEFVLKTIDFVLCEAELDLKWVDPFNSQEAIKRTIFIAKLYQQNLISDSVFFGYLYQALSSGHFLSSNLSESVFEATELIRSRLILTALKSFIDVDMHEDFYIYLNEYLAMLKCYLGSKTALSNEINELASDVYMAFTKKCFGTLRPDLDLMQFSKYPVYDLFIGKLDYLKNKSFAEIKAEDDAEMKARNEERMALELLELDREMSKMIGVQLEERKLERQTPQSAEVNLPQAGLLQKQTGGTSSLSATGAPTILLKKKKKVVLKQLMTKQ